MCGILRQQLKFARRKLLEKKSALVWDTVILPHLPSKSFILYFWHVILGTWWRW